MPSNSLSLCAEPPLQVHYNELLRVIGDIGRDVKPAYTSSKSSIDKLRKSELDVTLIEHCLLSSSPSRHHGGQDHVEGMSS